MNQTTGPARKVAEDSDLTGDRIGPQGAGSGTGQKGQAKPEDLADIAGGVATGIAGAAVEQGRQLYETARGQATSFVDGRKNDAAQSIADLASSLRESGSTFEGRPNISTFVSSAADGLDQLAGGIRDRSFAELYSEIEGYARRQPVTVAVVATVAGFLAARFIKSSAEELSSAAASRRSTTGGGPATGRRSATRAPGA